MADIGTHTRPMQGWPEAHNAIPVWNAENWFYEDFRVGDQIRTIRRTISEGDAMTFNTLVMDLHPYVADRHFAENEGVFGRRLMTALYRKPEYFASVAAARKSDA